MLFSDRAVYLGDGLYADFDGFQFELSSSDGTRKTNTVYLEPAVVRAFQDYIGDTLKAIRAKEQENEEAAF